MPNGDVNLETTSDTDIAESAMINLHPVLRPTRWKEQCVVSRPRLFLTLDCTRWQNESGWMSEWFVICETQDLPDEESVTMQPKVSGGIESEEETAERLTGEGMKQEEDRV
jgi:hypothetical protein